ncbi:MAG: T9SS type A sorting domain-containing protein [Saprospiraceae bacterium]
MAYQMVSTFTPDAIDQFVQIAPNPATDLITAQVSDSFTGHPFEIIGFNGQVIQKGTFEGSSTSIDVSQWPAGMYFIRATNPQGSITRTFSVK